MVISNHKKICYVFMILCCLTIAVNMVRLFAKSGLDDALVGMGLGAISAILFFVASLRETKAYMITQIFTVVLVSNVSIIYSGPEIGVIGFAIAMLLAYVNGFYESHSRIKFIATFVVVIIMISIFVPNNFPESLFLGIKFSGALAVFFYLVMLIISYKKIKNALLEKELVSAVKNADEAINLLKKKVLGG